MRFALSTNTSISASRLLPAWRTLSLSALALGFASCSSTPEMAEQPPTPRAVTRAEVQSGTVAPPQPPPLEESRGWFGGVPKLWPFGGGNRAEAEVAAAPSAAASAPATRGKPAPAPAASQDATATAAATSTDQEERKPGFFRRAAGVLPFVSSGDPDDVPPPPRSPRGSGSNTASIPDVPETQRTRARSKDLRGLELLVSVNPQSPSMSDDRRIGVNIVLLNSGKRSVALRFGSTQSRDILIRDANGSLVTRWSEDYVFQPSLTSLVINPGERVEYKETISTRELAPNRDYLLDVGIQGYSELQVSIPLRTRP